MRRMIFKVGIVREQRISSLWTIKDLYHQVLYEQEEDVQKRLYDRCVYVMDMTCTLDIGGYITWALRWVCHLRVCHDTSPAEHIFGGRTSKQRETATESDEKKARKGGMG